MINFHVPVNWLEWILVIAYAITLLGCILAVITENRNPIRTISWLMVLILVPVVGMFFFYLFGQDTRKMKHISTRYYKRVKDLTFDTVLTDKTKLEVNDMAVLSGLLEKSNNSAIMKGSEIEIITDGNRKYDLLLADIEAAKHHIHFEYFIFYNDETGNLFKNALMKKAKEGVKVRFLYDNVANWFVPQRYYNEMKSAGVEVSSFMKVTFPMFHSKVNYRNHRKVAVIDGSVGYMGGMNISNDYRIWRDTHTRITGKGVHGLQANFILDWYSSGMSLIEEPIYFPPCQVETDNLMQIVTGGPVQPWRNLLQATIYIVMNAKKYLYIQTPYFLPTDGLLQSLQAAALGDVDVRMMLPEKADMAIVNPAAHSYFEELLKTGVKIYIYKNRFIHSKSIVCDDFISVLGSMNMDFRSFESNFEINAYMYDPEFALRMKNIFLEDMKNCEEITLSKWVRRPVRKKLWESVCRIFAPLY